MGNLATNWRDKPLQAVSSDVPWTAHNLEGLAQELLANLTASGVAIVREDPELAGTLVCVVSVGACVPPRAAHVDPTSGISGRCVRERRTQLCYDSRLDPRVERAASERLGLRSLVAVPLVVGSRCIGLIEAVSDRPGHFDGARATVVESAANRTAALLAAQPNSSESIKVHPAPSPCNETAHPIHAPVPFREAEEASAQEVHVDRSVTNGQPHLQFGSAERTPRRRSSLWSALIAAALLAAWVSFYLVHRHTEQRITNSQQVRTQASPSDIPAVPAITPKQKTATPPTGKVNASDAAPHLAAADGARRGLVSDQIRVAQAYMTGNGVPKSPEKAASWYIIAGENGSATAKRRSIEVTRGTALAEIAQIRFDVGKMYMDGIGTRKDYVAAYTWFELAKAAGDIRAEHEEEVLQTRMQPHQVREGKHRASAWLQSHLRKLSRPR